MVRAILTNFFLVVYCINSIYSSENETVWMHPTTTSATQRTQQITSILDGLLENYQAQIRPNFGGNEKIIFDRFFS